MHREVVPDIATDDDKDDSNCTKNYDLRNMIVNSKHDEQSEHSENHEKIFSESCKLLRSEENPSSDLQKNHRHIEDEMQCDEQKVCECETTLIPKLLNDTEPLYENENSTNNTDDEETMLLNSIAKIFVIREVGGQNERPKILGEKMSTKESREKQEEIPRRKLTKKRTLAIVDALFSVVVVAPIVVFYWRGLWTLMDKHHDLFPAHVCFFSGMGLHTIFAILKHRFHANFAKELKAKSISARLGYRLVRMSYTYVFSAACIMHWRGGWIIFDDYIADHEWLWRFVTVTSVVILILLRSVRNLIAPPYVVAIDKRGYVFHFPTRFDVPGGFLSLINAHEINVSSQGEKIIETEA